jgi:hypothetical protein
MDAALDAVELHRRDLENVSGGLGANLTGAARAEVAVELQSADEIEPKRLVASSSS